GLGIALRSRRRGLRSRGGLGAPRGGGRGGLAGGRPVRRAAVRRGGRAVRGDGGAALARGRRARRASRGRAGGLEGVEAVDDVLGEVGAILGGLLEELEDELLDAAGEALADLVRQRRGLGGALEVQELARRGRLEGRAAGDHLVEDEAQAVEVAA